LTSTTNAQVMRVSAGVLMERSAITYKRNTDKVVERQLTSRLIQRFLDISLMLKLLYVIPLWEEQGA
jgi:hypothetical protein